MFINSAKPKKHYQLIKGLKEIKFEERELKFIAQGEIDEEVRYKRLQKSKVCQQ